MWLCTSRLLSAKVEGDWIGTTFFRTFFLRCSFCYPKPVKSSILKYKMGVLISNGQLRCCNACLDREIVPGHDTNLILFVPSTAVMYFPFFLPETPFFIQVIETQPSVTFIDLPNIYHFWSAAKYCLPNYLQNFDSFLMKQQLTLKCVSN